MRAEPTRHGLGRLPDQPSHVGPRIYGTQYLGSTKRAPEWSLLIASQECCKSGGVTPTAKMILCDLDLVAFGVGAGQLELDDLAVLQVTESETTSACNEDVEHRPA